MRWFYTHRKQILFFSLIIFAVLMFAEPLMGIASAATDSEKMLSDGTGIKGFDDIIRPIGRAFLWNARAIVTILIAVSGIMVCFGLDDGRKTMWSVILGLGLALNFGSYLSASFGNYMGMNYNQSTVGQLKLEETQPGEAKPIDKVEEAEKEAVDNMKKPNYEDWLTPKADTSAGGNGYHFFSSFVNSYVNYVIIPGATNIKGICIKLLLLICLIDSTIKLALDLTGGNLLKFLLTTGLKIGFYIFLIQNWVTAVDLPNSIATSLCNGFEDLGLRAAGYSLPSADYSTFSYICDNLLKSGFILLAGFFAILLTVGLFTSPAVFFLGLGLLLVVLVTMLWISLEMFMAMIEFYTMALLTMMLLPFNASEHFAFLSRNSIACLFNCALKVAVIAFLASAALPALGRYMTGLLTSGSALTKSNLIFYLIQLAIAGVVILFLLHNIPQIVNGVLTGSPSMGASSMVNTVKSVAATTVAVGTTVAGGAGAIAGGVSAAGGLKMSALKSAVGDAMSGKGWKGAANAFGDSFGQFMQGAGTGLKNHAISSVFSSAPVQSFQHGFRTGNPKENGAFNLSDDDRRLGATGRSWATGKAINDNNETVQPLTSREQHYGAVGRNSTGRALDENGNVIPWTNMKGESAPPSYKGSPANNHSMSADNSYNPPFKWMGHAPSVDAASTTPNNTSTLTNANVMDSATLNHSNIENPSGYSVGSDLRQNIVDTGGVNITPENKTMTGTTTLNHAVVDTGGVNITPENKTMTGTTSLNHAVVDTGGANITPENKTMTGTTTLNHAVVDTGEANITPENKTVTGTTTINQSVVDTGGANVNPENKTVTGTTTINHVVNENNSGQGGLPKTSNMPDNPIGQFPKG